METLKTQLSKDVQILLREFIEQKTSVFDGNFYVGKVVDNIDPDKQGRCRIRVYGLFEEIPDNDLPWAMMDNTFVGSKVGSFIVPPLDAIVRVKFENGDIYLPVYTTKVIDLNNKLSKINNLNFTGDPDILIFFATDQGEYFKINRKTKETEYRTATGDFVKIDNSGNIEINTENAIGTRNGKLTINSKGSIEVNVNSNISTDFITLNAPIVKIPHNVSGKVTPDITGGPMNCLKLCPYAGMIHQGQTLKNI
jgi:hypothetical protein